MDRGPLDTRDPELTDRSGDNRAAHPHPLASGATGSKYNFHVDRFTASEIIGWISDSDRHGGLTVEFQVDGVPSGVARADLERADVETAGRGPRRCGFQWSVPQVVAQAATRRDLPIDILVQNAGGQKEHLTRMMLQNDPTITGQICESVRPVLEHALVTATMTALGVDGGPFPSVQASLFPIHEKLFAFAGPRSGEFPRAVSPYVAFQHTRLRKDQTHPLDGSEATKNNFLRWYLDRYNDVRRPMRAPLGADEIAYLNAPVPLVGVETKLSRASLSYALTSPDAPALFPLGEGGAYENFVYWWATKRAPELHLEDCLVPEYYIDVLRGMPVEFMGQSFPLSTFLVRYVKSNHRFNVLDANLEAHRILIHVWVLLEAVASPGILRFLPPKNLSALFEGPPRKTLFDRIVQNVHPSGIAIGEVFNAQNYHDVLARSGFDVTRRRFTTFDKRGNRLEAARYMPATARSEKVKVQVIGPFDKASGLGQATRLSVETLRAAGHTPNVVNFDLDNPAPVGMGSAPQSFGSPRPAEVNLIHLNGETLPMALAYMPDVFNGAYNIGYFFWELSTPSSAQALALAMVDEIWVATDYGVSIYSAAVDKPVKNVGMAVEEVPDPGRDASRAYVSQRLPIGPETFVFMAAFDSFSFVERKNPHAVVRAFREAFTEDEDVLLVLKTHNRDFVKDPHQILRWERIVEIAASDPRIVILNETLRYGDLMKLKRGIDCYVSLHRSEGWGFGMIEAMQLGVPVVTTAYSGNMEFTKKENCWLVDYDLIEPRQGEYIFVDRGQVWADPRIPSAIKAMRAVRSEKHERERRAAVARQFVRANFSLPAQARKYKSRLTEIFAGLRK